MPDRPKLNYAPSYPMYQRRAFRCWVYALVLSGVIASGWWWGPAAWQRVGILYWQHLCMVNTPSPKLKVFDSAQGKGQISNAWSRFYKLVSPPGFHSDATLFLHELQRPDGKPRLVAVDLEKSVFDPQTSGNEYQMIARVFTPGDLIQPPKESMVYSPPFPVQISRDTQIFAGVCDPNSRCHFTIRCVMSGKTVVCDGWLQNDDSVMIGQQARPPGDK